MGRITANRIPWHLLAADREHIISLQSLPDYSPRNPEHSVPALQQLALELTQAEQDEICAQRALEVARERSVAVGIRLHRGVLGAKSEVIVQYGDDSPAVHAVGRKQKSERRRRARRAPTPV